MTAKSFFSRVTARGRKSCVAALAAGLLVGFGLSIPAHAQDNASYITFDVGGFPTYPVGINNKGEITGSWVDTSAPFVDFIVDGFVRTRCGQTQSFSVDSVTRPWGINHRSEVIGGAYYSDGFFPEPGFLRRQDGTLTKPLVSGPDVFISSAESINGNGEILGKILTRSFGSKYFVRDERGVVMLFDVPGYLINLVSINDAGVIVGSRYKDPDGTSGFVRDRQGKVTSFAIPGAKDTIPVSINNNGEIAGYWTEPSGTAHGFLRNDHGALVLFDFPGKLVMNVVFARHVMTLNDNGQVAGNWSDSAGETHGFVREKNGAIVSFRVPGSYNTIATSINNDGDITGSFDFGTGFIRTKPGHNRYECGPDEYDATPDSDDN